MKTSGKERLMRWSVAIMLILPKPQISVNMRQHCFEQTRKAWGLNLSDDLPLLTWAARVCKIGLDISHTQFNNHGAYLISHSDLMGFSKHATTGNGISW